MANITEKCIILSTKKINETDILLKVLSEANSHLVLTAKYALKSKKRFDGRLEPFSTQLIQYKNMSGNNKSNTQYRSMLESKCLDPRLNIRSTLENLELGYTISHFSLEVLKYYPDIEKLYAYLSRSFDLINTGQTLQAYLFFPAFIKLLGIELEYKNGFAFYDEHHNNSNNSNSSSNNNAPPPSISIGEQWINNAYAILSKTLSKPILRRKI